MKNVLLVNMNKNMNPLVPPIGLEFIATPLVDAGYEVKIYDIIFSSGTNKLKEKVNWCDIVCMTFRNLDTGSLFERGYYIDDLRRMVTLIKKYKDVKIILGGQGFSIAPEEILDYTHADYGIINHGEYAILDLLNNVSEGDKRIYNGNEYPIYNKFHRRNLIDYNTYIKYGASLGIVTNVGCPEKCNYCVEHEQSYNEVAVDNVMQEARDLYKYSDHFIICDSEFNHNQKQSNRFMERLIAEEYQIKYYAYLKPSRLEERYVRNLKESGCVGISIGIDSLNESRIGILQRQFKKGDVEQMFKLLYEYDLSFVPSFVVGFPWNDIDELKDEIEFCQNYNANYISVNMGVRLYPHTSFTKSIASELHTNKERFRGIIDNNDSLLKPVYYIKDEDFLEQVCQLPKQYNVKIIGL